MDVLLILDQIWFRVKMIEFFCIIDPEISQRGKTNESSIHQHPVIRSGIFILSSGCMKNLHLLLFQPQQTSVLMHGMASDLDIEGKNSLSDFMLRDFGERSKVRPIWFKFHTFHHLSLLKRLQSAKLWSCLTRCSALPSYLWPCTHVTRWRRMALFSQQRQSLKYLQRKIRLP